MRRELQSLCAAGRRDEGSGLALSVKSFGFASSPKGRALGIAAKFSEKPKSVRFRQSLSLWERWHGASRDGEGEHADHSAALSQKAAL